MKMLENNCSTKVCVAEIRYLNHKHSNTSIYTFKLCVYKRFKMIACFKICDLM